MVEHAELVTNPPRVEVVAGPERVEGLAIYPPAPPPLKPLAPMVHNNGTGRQELENQLSTAGAAVRSAMEALRAAYPNGRDYYIQDTFKAACAEWDARLEALQGIYRETFQIYENVADQD